jgi:hypothetical protein
MLALMVFHIEFSLIAAIGVILLIGIVKKNAILMIDFALDAERTLGLDPREAIFEACMMRFRPIAVRPDCRPPPTADPALQSGSSLKSPCDSNWFTATMADQPPGKLRGSDSVVSRYSIRELTIRRERREG